ncbi:hypothetical protein L1987_48755 [Smallanthus sonchifolius]|uniref:Uncharacterized protein n=1 Tax=Smallanthus sonchifolius TaxID=185202 RepID=A0ACB9FSU9_9ASTR|nr:hypothetical protein L1987_48755 [Smallanthus sonchifolius]
MARWTDGIRCLLLLAAIAFIYTQVRLFKAQSEYAEKISAALTLLTESSCLFSPVFLLFYTGADHDSWNRLSLTPLRGRGKSLYKPDAVTNSSDKHAEGKGCGFGGIHIQPSASVTCVSEKVKQQQEEREQLRTLVQNLERKGVKNLFQQNQVPVAAVVIMACNRADYLERTIKSILKYHTSASSKFPVFVSQDGSNSDVKTKALSYKQLTYMQHLDYEPVHTERPGELIAYYKIARHYKWALDQLFYKHNFNRVIILEDDMEISPDFFNYFEAGADLLDKDKSIMAISSWNDNGQKQFVHDPYYKKIIKGGSLFVQKFAERTTLIDWKSMNLTYLMEDKFVKHFADLVKGANPLYGTDFILKMNNIKGDARINYRDQLHFEEIARQFGIFEEWKDGIPRTAYKGVVVFRYQTRRIFLVGPDSLEQLGIQNY